MFLKRVAIVVTFAVGGCAEMMADSHSRVCMEGGLPSQCESVQIELRCDRPLPSRQVAGIDTRIAIQVTEGVDAPIVGELFSQFCPPDCIDIQLTGPPPWQTLRADVSHSLQRHGYEVAKPSPATDRIVDLVGVRADVRSDDPGWTSMKITTRAVVGFTATLFSGGSEVWSAHFVGESQLASAYASVADSQQVFSEAYCSALEEFAATVSLGTLEAVDGD